MTSPKTVWKNPTNGPIKMCCRINSHETAPQKTGDSSKGMSHEIQVLVNTWKEKNGKKHEIFPNLPIIV